MDPRNRSGLLACLVLVFLTACAFRGPFGGQLGVSSTSDAIRTQAVGTALAALTAQARLDQQPTATPVPSPTLADTSTPLPPTASPVPSATQTATTEPTRPDYPTRTSTPAQVDFVCTIEEIEPATNETVKVGTQFNLAVRLKNSGHKSWQPGQVIFMYTSGQKMQTKSGTVVLLARIDKDGETSFSVPAAAPDTPGKYETTWALYTNGLFFCPIHFYVTASP